jgi:hypothetical protein
MPTNKLCEKCGRSFTTAKNLTIHMNRKNPCDIQMHADPLHLEFPCLRCEKIFYTKQNLNMHLKRKFPCKIQSPDPQETELQLLFEKLLQENEQRKLENEQRKLENEQQQLEIEKLQSAAATNTTNNNTTNNNTTNNNTTNNNNITINMYGKENMAHINDQMYKDCFKFVYKSIENFFKMKHLSENMKENHNLYVTNMNGDHMMMLMDGEWGLVEKEETFDTIYEDIRGNLSDKFNTLRDEKQLDPMIEKQFAHFADDYAADAGGDEEHAKKESCKKMAYLAYNKRHYPMDAYKQSIKK